MQKASTEIFMPPFIKWAGGKEKELHYIISNLPPSFNGYYEPFVGGGSVYAALNAQRTYINDKCSELINLFNYIKSQDNVFFEWVNLINRSWTNMRIFVSQHIKLLTDIYVSYRLGTIDENKIVLSIWNFVDTNTDDLVNIIELPFAFGKDIYLKEIKNNILRKFRRMRKLEKEKYIMPDIDVSDNIETAFMGALYLYYRHLYNDNNIKQSNNRLATALFLYIRNYSYSGMFRYNHEGKFNVPYGGIAYNSKTLDKKINYYQSQGLQTLLNRTEIFNLDFEAFFEQVKPSSNDFIFLDPPYDSDFNTYAGNEFTKDDHRRLSLYLCNKCHAKWMMIIKYTPYIYDLYKDKGLSIQSFEKKYLVSFMNRNNKDTNHLIIKNY